MATFAWIVFAGSILGIIGIFLSKIPQILEKPQVRIKIGGGTESILAYLWRKLEEMTGRVWHFILEAKDLRPNIHLNQPIEKVKKVFKIRIRQNEQEPVWLPEVVEPIPSADGTKVRSAEGLYLEAIKKDPHNLEAYEGLGRLYLQEKNFTEALEIYKYLSAIAAEKDVYWSNLGLCLFSMNDFVQAAKAYEKALSINSKIPARHINLAYCYDKENELGKAIKAVNAALALDGRNLGYLSFLADLYARLPNKVRAEQVLQQILEMEPTNRQARERLMKLRI
jgi:tetratricopeptide (TPR) repeat protein